MRRKSRLGGRTPARKLHSQANGNEGYNCTDVWSYHISAGADNPTHRWAAAASIRLEPGYTKGQGIHPILRDEFAVSLCRLSPLPKPSQKSFILLSIAWCQDEAAKFMHVQYFSVRIHSHTLIQDWTTWELWLTSAKKNLCGEYNYFFREFWMSSHYVI